MLSITLAQAQYILEQGIEKIKHMPGKAVCISICDAQGFLVSFVRMDEATLRSIEIAQRKAYSSVRLGLTTAAFDARLKREDIPISYFGDTLLTALPGGSVVLNASGGIIGGVGVSGLTPQEDQGLADELAGFIRAH
ncbi:GlcG/HbpS family heme-binding protein [Allopusillimonas ginsengisoli]|uniref:GlcG/HbpS family heme-binding protein n=1 Tax=Allopusillimonas ginsengisoli TaxID=453575 RepID=UPI0010C21284|nr:heme-binding protein [Allopusillimonas ginsengisoli]